MFDRCSFAVISQRTFLVAGPQHPLRSLRWRGPFAPRRSATTTRLCAASFCLSLAFSYVASRPAPASAAAALAPLRASAQQNQNLDNVEIHALPVQGNVYMLVGAGGNITLQVGSEGVLLVDTQFAQLSDKVLAAIRRLSTKPIRYTHY